MAAVLTAHHFAAGDGELVTTEQIDVSYANLRRSEIERDFAVLQHEVDGLVGYVRTGWDDTPQGRAHYVIAPIQPAHVTRPLFRGVVDGFERRVTERIVESGDTSDGDVMRWWMHHPGPGLTPANCMAAWLEELEYQPVRFGASMVRPHLDDIPELALPDGVEVRPARPDHFRAIWEAHAEAFAGSWGEADPGEEEWQEFLDDPTNDPALWRVAWCGDQVVGQVRSFINHQENSEIGRLRGYTEQIATHPDWRGRGIASALLALSLAAVRDRGMTEAALGVDTENPANALAIYQRLGFRLVAFEATYDKPVGQALRSG